MRILGPNNKLDSRFCYTVVEAKLFFNELNPAQYRSYFYAELLDLGFLALYGTLSYLLFKKFFHERFAPILFLPASLDFVETALIIGKITGQSVNLQILSWSSTLKWSSGILIFLLVMYRYLRFRKIDA